MPHAIHFLSQLERADTYQCELALKLYHTPAFVRCVLENVKLPEGVSRVAISVDPEDEGPYVIVEADGGFVTCLGKGMTTDLPIVAYTRLQSFISRVEDLEARKEMEERRGDKLIDWVLKSADRLSREDFLAISALQPVLKFDFLKCGIDSSKVLAESLLKMSRIKRARRRDRAILRMYWEHVFITGHMTALFAFQGATGMEHHVEQIFERLTPSFIAVRNGEWATALRGIWSAGRLGRIVLPVYKAAFRRASTVLEVVDALAGLDVLGSRHRKARPEIVKFLQRTGIPQNTNGDPVYGDFIELAIEGMTSPDEHYELLLKNTKTIIMKERSKLPPAYSFSSQEEIPDDLALSFAFNLEYDYVNNADAIRILLKFIPALARVEAPMLYLSSSYLDSGNWKPEKALELVRRLKMYVTPRPRPAHLGRKTPLNAPCPCGSGKKYKRCCLPKEKEEESKKTEGRDETEAAKNAEEEAPCL